MKNYKARTGGKSSRGKGHRKNKKTEKNHNKWLQHGCQNDQNQNKGQSKCNQGQTGGGGLMGGAAWAPSNIYPTGSVDPQQNEIITAAEATGTHYSLNNQIMQAPQASNALVEMANNLTGGGSRRKRKARSNHRKQKKSQRRHKKSHRGRKGIKLACQNQNQHEQQQQQQGGSATAYLPMNMANTIRGMGDSVGGFIHNMQGGLTPYNYSDPTHQPIGNTSKLM
jgi:hypothetical protein